MSLRLVGYLRVSGPSQVDGYSLDLQEDIVRRWAAKSGHIVVGMYADEGVSGAREAAARPGLSAALSRLQDPGRVDGLVVAQIDRLARSLTVQEATLALIWRGGGRLFTATDGEVLSDDLDDPARTFVRKVMGLVIEYEKDQTVKRMRQGRQVKAEAGKKAG